ncbi:hypothetical protein ACOMHN_005283 [Nucella lapillus]
MPDGVTLPSPHLLTSQGTDLITDPGNGTMARVSLEPRETGLLPRGYPWIPALLVGCGMVVFLSLSFYSHHKRVRRKRELLMDYLSVLLYSGVGSRGRSVSILCNTNSLALSQLGKSFRITHDKKEKSASPDFLTKRYLNDLAELSSSHQKSKNVLNRFISSPTDSKFQHMASQLMGLNRATRVGRGGLGNLARNLSVPEDFDPSDTDFPWSLTQASAGITQGVLLDPTRMQRDDADASNPFKRCDTNPESVSDHSYENIAFSDQADFSKDFTKTTQSNIPCLNRDSSDLSVQNSKLCKTSSSKAPSLRTMWFLNKPSTPASHFGASDRQWVERWHVNSTSDLLTDRCVSVTRGSVLPPCVHSVGVSYYSSRQTHISGNRHLLHNDSFLAECKKDYIQYDESLSSQYPEMHFSTVKSVEQNNKYNPGSVHERNSPVLHEQASCAGRDVDNSTGTPRLQESISSSFDPLSDHDSSTYSRDSSLHLDEVHDRSLDEVSRQYGRQFFDMHSSQVLGCCRSLHDSAVGSRGRFPMPQRMSSVEYNPVFPGETNPTVNACQSTPVFPTAFSHALYPDSHDRTQADPLLPSGGPRIQGTDSVLNPIVPSRGTNLTITRMMQSKLHSKIPSSFRHPKPKSRGFLNKAMSSQSTKTLISEAISPAQSFSNASFEFHPSTSELLHTPATSKLLPATSELVPATQPQRFPCFHENPEMTAMNPLSHDSSVCDQPAAQLFFLDEPVGDIPPWQTCEDAKCSNHPSMTFPTTAPTDRKVSSSYSRMTDVHKGQLDTLISLDNLSSSADSWQNVRPASHVHRLPRFQVRSGLTQTRDLLARPSTLQGVDMAQGTGPTDQDRDSEDPLWASGPHDTQI